MCRPRVATADISFPSHAVAKLNLAAEVLHLCCAAAAVCAVACTIAQQHAAAPGWLLSGAPAGTEQKAKSATTRTAFSAAAAAAAATGVTKLKHHGVASVCVAAIHAAAAATGQGGFQPEMNRREAALILGLRESAAEERVKEAHRRIMIANHPDSGEHFSNIFIAAKVNEAKDMLLGKKSKSSVF
ncbi:hypothetical protein COO60DRAFT_1272562 [Scenedesmus sp. NREL 46B-D3]|nr:hypothetical protein COO60DRAFT_1272562 [Scenedesmus sp. NREL 46B-D3]